MNNYQKNAIYSLILLVFLISIYFYRQRNNEIPAKDSTSDLVYIKGITMGVVEYNIKYRDSLKRNFQEEIDALLKAFNQSLSTYIPDSEISTFNQDTAIQFNSRFFYPVLVKSKEVYEISEGAFDPTLGPIIKAWGFGKDKIEKIPSPEVVDSLKTLVGFDKLRFNESSLKKEIPGVMLDFSAVAKGYAVDVVSELLEEKGIKNYLVDIGREVRCQGKNDQDKTWVIGIVNPIYKEEGQEQATGFVSLKDQAMATSGNYEQFYIQDGKKYSHTIDPKSGYPVEHSLLSASVFAPDCMTADAYATAFMVLGLEKGKQILEQITEIEGYLIYEDEEGNLQTFSSKGIAGAMIDPKSAK